MLYTQQTTLFQKMKIRIVQITSSNNRPCDHPEFLGDIRNEPDEMELEKAMQWIPFYLGQGDKLEIERVDI